MGGGCESEVAGSVHPTAGRPGSPVIGKDEATAECAFPATGGSRNASAAPSVHVNVNEMDIVVLGDGIEKRNKSWEPGLGNFHGALGFPTYSETS